MNIEVTSVSRHSEKLAEVASAIQVITHEDIKRSAATTLPEVLRLIPNLQVAQLNSYGAIISSRGFNAAFSNKLLVMIDGRTVYSPLFAGVFWDAQDVLLEDVERIEVVSGPGGTLWGPNAVNGVINIITKKTHQTQGLYVSGATGTYLKAYASLRYGGKVGEKFSYRLYIQQRNRDHTLFPNRNPYNDRWNMTQGGIRADWQPTDNNNILVIGNAYAGTEYTAPRPSYYDGQNLQSRWTHSFSDSSNLVVQAYAERTWRKDVPSTISDEMYTCDIDVQHRFALGAFQSLTWGGNYRYIDDMIINGSIWVGFLPEHRIMPLYSVFVQDEINIIPDRLNLAAGARLLNNAFTGFELQPSGAHCFQAKLRPYGVGFGGACSTHAQSY